MPLWQDKVIYFVHWLYNHYTGHFLQEIMHYLWNDGVKEWIPCYELWVTSVVFNFQREKTVAGNEERKADTQYGERQRWRTVTLVKRLKRELKAKVLESTVRKVLRLPESNPMSLYISTMQVIQFLELQSSPIGTRMLERGSSNSKT